MMLFSAMMVGGHLAIAVADKVPNLNFEPICREAASESLGVKDNFEFCRKDELAAREQLAIVARSINASLYEGKVTEATPGTDAVLRLAREAKREAASYGCDILIVDTAGRNHIDSALMDEMAALKKLLNPSEILFIADAMTGQDAVKSAKSFHDLLALTGVVLTKMDGDARGGAALSIRHVTGAPIKFLGTGEKPDAFEPFHPDRIVSRIMGMGDIATLLERAEEKLDRGKAEQFARVTDRRHP